VCLENHRQLRRVFNTKFLQMNRLEGHVRERLRVVEDVKQEIKMEVDVLVID
jgi:hypothetical protein